MLQRGCSCKNLQKKERRIKIQRPCLSKYEIVKIGTSVKEAMGESDNCRSLLNRIPPIPSFSKFFLLYHREREMSRKDTPRNIKHTINFWAV